MVCCLFGEVGVAKALDPVDLGGRCVGMSIPAWGSVTPNDICSAAGYGSCEGAIGTLMVCSMNDCTGVCHNVVGLTTCGGMLVETMGIDRKSAMITGAGQMLSCEARTWGTIPQPDNVPGDFEQSIKNTTDWILGFVAMIAVLMLIWGGINYLTSAGDEDKAKTGKKTISYAIIGLVIAGIAYAIVNVIITVIL